jgi:hypothetical protein
MDVGVVDLPVADVLDPRFFMSAVAPEAASAPIAPPCPSGFVAMEPLSASSIRPVCLSMLGMVPCWKNITSCSLSPKWACFVEERDVARG